MVLAPINHIWTDERGLAYIADSQVKVADIAVDSVIWGFSANQIQDNYPHLSLGQIHAALAYYHDHRKEVDRQIAESDEEYERVRARNPNPLPREEFERRLARTRTQG